MIRVEKIIDFLTASQEDVFLVSLLGNDVFLVFFRT